MIAEAPHAQKPDARREAREEDRLRVHTQAFDDGDGLATGAGQRLD